MVFPVVMYGCESWTIKKAECWRIDAAELWCWRRFLRVSWTAKRSNKSILKEINLEYSLEGLMLKAEAPKIWPSDVMSQIAGGLSAKATVFPVVMCGCESWTIKKAECQRIDAFELWCWRKLLRFLWTARRSNQSILKEINPEYSLEWLMLKLKLQYFGHLMKRADSLENTLMLGKIEGKREGRDNG